MNRVCLLPSLDDGATGGVASVLRALRLHLPAVGWHVAASPDRADVVHGHAVLNDREMDRLDVYTSHGVYPGADGMQKALNERMYACMRRASVVTSVAEWPVEQYRDATGVDPVIVRNGVDVAALDAVKAGLFRRRMKVPAGAKTAVWAKTTLDGVCADGFRRAWEIAWACRRVRFWFTLWDDAYARPGNVEVVGVLPAHEYLRMVRDCDVFLSTTVENFPMAVLEAMALGKPVLAYAGGGNSEVLMEGAYFRDVGEAAAGMARCLQDGPAMGVKNRDTAERDYSWRGQAEAYAGLYEKVLALKRRGGLAASVVVTNYNLKPYLRASLLSALNQAGAGAHEVILVDDASMDGSLDAVADLLPRVRLIRHERNAGASASRNAGVEAAAAPFVCCLDGDDVLAPDYLKRLLPLMADKDVGVAVPTWAVARDGKPGATLDPGKVTLDRLKAGNCVPCASLFRRRAWELAGRYKRIDPSWEDYDLWLTMAERGWRFATAAGAPAFFYTLKGAEGRNAESQGQERRLRAVVDAWHPRLYAPAVSVVVPTYTHPELLPESVGSIMAQTFQGFEVVVVDDGAPAGSVDAVLAKWKGDPRVRVVHQQNKGLAAARNAGVRAARGKYVLPLDDDDKFDPAFLEKALFVEERAGGNVVGYCDFWPWEGGDKRSDKPLVLPDYTFDGLLIRDHLPSASLYPRAAWEKAGGYDEAMRGGLEDWEFWIRLGVLGYCGARIAEPLFYYRQSAGSMRNRMQADAANEFAAQAHIVEKHAGLYKGERPMGCCGQRAVVIDEVKLAETLSMAAGTGAVAPDGSVRLHYKGLKFAPVDIMGYRASATRPFVNAEPKDVHALIETGQFEMAQA